MVQVIDDFLFFSPSFQKCKEDLAAFIALCQRIGVPLAPGKTSGPTTFLGIMLDSVRMENRLPDNKLAKARSLLLSLQSRQKVTLKELQPLTYPTLSPS